MSESAEKKIHWEKYGRYNFTCTIEEGRNWPVRPDPDGAAIVQAAMTQVIRDQVTEMNELMFFSRAELRLIRQSMVKIVEFQKKAEMEAKKLASQKKPFRRKGNIRRFR